MRLRYWHLLILALSIAAAPFTFADDASAQPEGIKADIEKAEIKVEKDLKKVLDAAKADGKKIMLEFSGSDWCPPCKMLHRFIIKTRLRQRKAACLRSQLRQVRGAQRQGKLRRDSRAYRNLPNSRIPDYRNSKFRRRGDRFHGRPASALGRRAHRKNRERQTERRRKEVRAKTGLEDGRIPGFRQEGLPKKASCAAASQSAAPAASDSNACQKPDSTKRCSAKGYSACTKPQGQNASVGAAAQK